MQGMLDRGLHFMIATAYIVILPIVIAQFTRISMTPRLLLSMDDYAEVMYVLRGGASLLIAFIASCGLSHLVIAFDVDALALHTSILVLTAVTSFASAAFLTKHRDKVHGILSRVEIMPQGISSRATRLAVSTARAKLESDLINAQEALASKEALEANILDLIESGQQRIVGIVESGQQQVASSQQHRVRPADEPPHPRADRETHLKPIGAHVEHRRPRRDPSIPARARQPQPPASKAVAKSSARSSAKRRELRRPVHLAVQHRRCAQVRSELRAAHPQATHACSRPRLPS
jgi:hypothetical protein